MKRRTKSKVDQSEGTRRTDEKVIQVILAERARFHRFVASRVGDAATAEDVLQDSLLRALGQNRSLRRGEAAVPWFYRILRNAISDHYRKKGSENRRMEKLLTDMEVLGEDTATPPVEWEKAVCGCFRGLLPALKPRYATVILRVDLGGEGKRDVARDLKVSQATMDVLLHRARQALRKRLEVFCGSCSREHCLACLCKRNDAP